MVSSICGIIGFFLQLYTLPSSLTGGNWMAVILGILENRAAAFDDNVYNKFETKLIAALSDCANINIPATQEGGIINPYQLVSTGIKGC